LANFVHMQCAAERKPQAKSDAPRTSHEEAKP